MITYEQVKSDREVQTYAKMADDTLKAMGYTEHSTAHTVLCATRVEWLLRELEYDDRTIELAKIAAILHDIGNLVNRVGHAHHGAIIAFHILDKMGMPANEIAQIVTAIGHHDEETAQAVTAINSALIIADKSDVRHTRVRNKNQYMGDIHDRVNYAVKKSELSYQKAEKTLTLSLTIDTQISSITDYFEIFLGRMLLCRKAAEFFNLAFKLDMNGNILL